mmetsp:Transcript_17979/g.43227  ORF Transcript_17979/g.43227 Transcript_17979/m.43227 type:complete len:225 (+) Transcript_17979:889-1563(+)
MDSLPHSTPRCLFMLCVVVLEADVIIRSEWSHSFIHPNVSQILSAWQRSRYHTNTRTSPIDHTQLSYTHRPSHAFPLAAGALENPSTPRRSGDRNRSTCNAVSLTSWAIPLPLPSPLLHLLHWQPGGRSWSQQYRRQHYHYHQASPPHAQPRSPQERPCRCNFCCQLLASAAPPLPTQPGPSRSPPARCSRCRICKASTPSRSSHRDQASRAALASSAAPSGRR